MSLTFSEEKFCQEYVRLHDGKSAAIAAGYDTEQAEMIGKEKLRKNRIKKRIDEIRIQFHTNLSAVNGVHPAQQDKKSRSKIIRFIQQPWVITIAIVFALVGGGPGIMNAWKYFQGATSLDFTVVDIVTGETDSEYAILLIGSLYNNGERPLISQTFNLEVLVNDRFIKAKKSFLPKELFLKKDSVTMAMDATKQYDLQQVTRLDPSIPVQGELMFYIPKSLTTHDELMKGKFVLWTKDLSNKRHECVLDLSDIAKRASLATPNNLK